MKHPYIRNSNKTNIPSISKISYPSCIKLRIKGKHTKLIILKETHNLCKENKIQYSRILKHVKS